MKFLDLRLAYEDSVDLNKIGLLRTATMSKGILVPGLGHDDA
jgi:hypothetical protein